jgi:hypothetical protein
MADRELSDVELERLLAADLPPRRARELEQRATDADRARLAELRAEHAAYLASVDVAAEVRGIAQRVARMAPAVRPRAWLRWAISGGALAAAVAALLVVMLRPGQPPDDDITIKGDEIALVVHAASDSGSRPLQSGDTVAPGTRIRFEVAAPRAGHVAVIGLDGAGATTVYYPYGGRAPAAYDPAAGRLLPGAIALDATPGDERFTAVYARAPFALDAGVAAIRARTALPGGVAAAEVVLHKK